MISLHARWKLVIGMLAAVLLSSLAHAQHDVRAWPDPGYGRLGVYAGGPDSYFDYQLAKLSLGDTFPNKKAYWAALQANESEKRTCVTRHPPAQWTRWLRPVVPTDDPP